MSVPVEVPSTPQFEAALEAHRRGFTPLPLHAHSEKFKSGKSAAKKPVGNDWQHTHYKTEDEIALAFGSPRGRSLMVGNVGVLLGEPSGGLLDVDLDDPLAVQLAPRFLPPTPARFGRESKRLSHWLYLARGEVPRVKRERGKDGETIVEVRGAGGQTVIPPSIHESGESIEWGGESWGGDDGPTEVDAAELKVQAGLLALTVELAKAWPRSVGSRHELSLALAGALLRDNSDDGPVCGFWEEHAPLVFEVLAEATGDEEVGDRLESIRSTAKNLRDGLANITGWPTVAELLGARGDDVVAKAREHTKAIEEAAGVSRVGGDPLGDEAVVEIVSSDDEAQLVRDAFPLLDIVALLDPARPPRRWLWDQLIPEGEHVSIVAPAGQGKSLLVLSLVAAALLGDGEFGGRALNLRRGARVLYIDMENSDDDWAERLPDVGFTQAKAKALLGVTFFPLSMPDLGGLDTKRGATNLTDVLDAYGFEAGDVVVLDSQQRVTEGDENANDTMRGLYRNTSVELKRRCLTVIRTDNTGWDRTRERGASSKRDDVGMALLMVPDEKQPGVFSLVRSKRRSKPKAGGADPGSITLKQHVGRDGRLRYLPTKSSFPDLLLEAKALLDRLGAPYDLGLNKAWRLVQDERDRALGAGETFPEGMRKALIERAQTERRPPIDVVDSPLDEGAE